MKSNHSLSKYRSANPSNGSLDLLSNELLYECKNCVEGTRLSKFIREQLERYVVNIGFMSKLLSQDDFAYDLQRRRGTLNLRLCLCICLFFFLLTHTVGVG